MQGFNWRRLSRCGRHDGVHHFFSLSSQPTRAWRHAKSKLMSVFTDKSWSRFVSHFFFGLIGSFAEHVAIWPVKHCVHIIYAWHLLHFVLWKPCSYSGSLDFIMLFFCCMMVYPRRIPVRIKRYSNLIGHTWKRWLSLLTFWLFSKFLCSVEFTWFFSESSSKYNRCQLSC